LFIDSHDKLLSKALSIAIFNLGLPSTFAPPTFTAAFISRANFCQILLCNCCFFFIPSEIKCFLGMMQMY
jgi:hypothetical protein